MKKKLLTLSCFFLNFFVFSQNIKNEKFGIINATDFAPKLTVNTSSAAAIVLSDVGSSEFVGNNNGRFTIVFKQHKKILIKSKTAFDAATFKVWLYQGGYDTEEKLENVEAATYNLVDGKIVITKLSSENVVKEKYNRFYNIKKFTMPEVKEGSIIEYSYVTKSIFDMHLHNWDFQSEYPTLYSDFQVTIPPMYNYVVVEKGRFRDNIALDSTKKIFKVYSIVQPGEGAYSNSSIYTFSGEARSIWWVMKDVPAYKNEDFVANKKDNLLAVNFQLHSIQYSEMDKYIRIRPWDVTIAELYKNEKFGLVLNREELGWLNTEAEMVSGKLEGLDVAKKIYEHIKSRFICNNYDALYMSASPRKVYDSKKGNVADINLLLTSMLARRGFDAEPVFLSTRGNGKASEANAILEQYDYVICRLKVDTTTYFLDAADNEVGFGRLGTKCYNGYGRLISKIPYLVPLFTNDLQEANTTTVFIVNGEKNKIEGSVNRQLGYYESQQMRENLLHTNQADFFKSIAKAYPFEVKIQNEELENQKKYDEPMNIKYDYNFSLNDEDIIYFTPIQIQNKKDNIFKADKRMLPVEMPYTIDETYILDMEIPTGYMVDEMPKSVRTKYNENEGLFEYLISNKEGHLQLRSRFVLAKADYGVEDYESLREFYGLMLKKQAEQVVFKKIKK